MQLNNSSSFQTYYLCNVLKNVYVSSDDKDCSYRKACDVFKGDEESCRNCRILHVLNDCLVDRE